MSPSVAGSAVSPAAGQCLVKPNEHCWFWKSTAGGTAGNLSDPSALPVDKRAHQTVIEKNLWGHHGARLCPGWLKEVKCGWVVIADQETKTSQKVPASSVLVWYEGLLVLDAISKEEPKVPWLTDKLTSILGSERAKFKHGQLSAYLYIQKHLISVAVTGPQFYGTSGEITAHRRQLQNKAPPAETEPAEGWYAVQALADYLPPWEAFVHPKCGLYQDFYMVQWGPPHDKSDYSCTEHGSDSLGATWEPDECLPEDLDSLRMGMKRRWADQQKEREQLERERRERDLKACEDGNGDLGKRKSLESDDPEHQVKSPKIFNPMRLELITDLASPHIGHGVHNPLRSTADSEIKRGWPRSKEDYAPGFGPADPPGCCGPQCDCMEDWHLGRRSLGAGRPWVDTQARSVASEAAVTTFMGMQESVTRRGQYSGMHYLEANTDRHKRDDVAQVAFAAGFAKMLRGVLRSVSQRIPLAAVQADWAGENPGSLVRMLAEGFASDEMHPEAGGPFVPLQYQATGPPWLCVDAGSGAGLVKGELPAVSAGQTVQLSFSLTSMVPGKFNSMDCGIDITMPENGDSSLTGLTLQVIASVGRLQPPAFQEVVQERLSPVFDFEAGLCIEAPFGIWVQSMWEVATMTRSISVGQLFPTPIPPQSSSTDMP